MQVFVIPKRSTYTQMDGGSLANKLERDQDCVLLDALLGFPPRPSERAQWVVCVCALKTGSGPESQLRRFPAVRSSLTQPVSSSNAATPSG